MTEENDPEPLPKVIEPPQRTPKISKEEIPKEISKEPIKSSSKDEKLKDTVPAKIDKHLHDKLLMFAGIPIVVIVAIFAQYIYHNFYIIPLGERTLLNVVDIEINQAPWIAKTNGSKFALIHSMGLHYDFEYSNGDNNDVEFVWLKGNDKFNRLALTDSQLEVRILFSNSNWDLSISKARTTDVGTRMTVTELKTADNTQKFVNFNIVGLELSNADNYEINLSSEKEILVSFKTDDEESVAFEERYTSAEAEYDELFEDTFQLKAKLMPEFYQNMGKAALSLVLSSLYTEDRVFEATGQYNSRFLTPKLHFTHLHLPEGCEDLRTQGLAALSIIDLQPAAVLQLITSWTNLVNNYGAMPSNVSGILDYKTKIVPALFVLLDEYIEKNGITELKPAYPNIEKLGLSLIETGNNDLFEATPTSFFFEPIEQSTEKLYTVELHAMTVKASRVLKMTSAVFGSDEVIQKFSQFNEAIDNTGNLDKFLTEEGLHSDFVLRKNGKIEKEFVTARVSLAPLIFQLLSPDSKELEIILQKLGDPEALWSNYGIRSTEGVSIPQNYMILKALNYYAQQSSHNQETAHGLYARLRNHLIMFVAQEFKRTKTFWESHSDIDGHGQGRKDWLPSATILKIMSELY